MASEAMVERPTLDDGQPNAGPDVGRVDLRLRHPSVRYFDYAAPSEMRPRPHADIADKIVHVAYLESLLLSGDAVGGPQRLGGAL
jgi:hypothetical protein